jgi:hypothetical protein
VSGQKQNQEEASEGHDQLSTEGAFQGFCNPTHTIFKISLERKSLIVVRPNLHGQQVVNNAIDCHSLILKGSK